MPDSAELQHLPQGRALVTEELARAFDERLQEGLQSWQSAGGDQDAARTDRELDF